jgi:predicted branched-subunit amino acid permease
VKGETELRDGMRAALPGLLPNALGIDAVFPAFYLSLLVGEARGRRKAYEAAAVAIVITLALMPFSPPGLPVIVGSAAELLGLGRS